MYSSLRARKKDTEALGGLDQVVLGTAHEPHGELTPQGCRYLPVVATCRLAFQDPLALAPASTPVGDWG